jgi:hypothetical protein
VILFIRFAGLLVTVLGLLIIISGSPEVDVCFDVVSSRTKVDIRDHATEGDELFENRWVMISVRLC